MVGIVPAAGIPWLGRGARRSAIRRSLGFAQRCRPEVGVPQAVPAIQCRSAIRRSLGFAQRCRPEVGVPQAVPAIQCRSAIRDLAALRAAVPTGGRRSPSRPRDSARVAMRERRADAGRRISAGTPTGSVARRQGNADLWSAQPAAGGRTRRTRVRGGSPLGRDPGVMRHPDGRLSLRFAPRCRPEVGVPQAVPAIQCRSAIRRSLGFAQRCRPEVGVPQAVPAILRGWRCANGAQTPGDASRRVPPRAAWRAGTGTPTSGRHSPPEAGGRKDPSSGWFASRPGPRRSASAGRTPLAALRAAVPTGGRRSPSRPRDSMQIGYTRSRCASPSGADQRSAFPKPSPRFNADQRFAIWPRFAPRCRPEVGVP